MLRKVGFPQRPQHRPNQRIQNLLHRCRLRRRPLLQRLEPRRPLLKNRNNLSLNHQLNHAIPAAKVVVDGSNIRLGRLCHIPYRYPVKSVLRKQSLRSIQNTAFRFRRRSLILSHDRHPLNRPRRECQTLDSNHPANIRFRQRLVVRLEKRARSSCPPENDWPRKRRATTRRPHRADSVSALLKPCGAQSATREIPRADSHSLAFQFRDGGGIHNEIGTAERFGFSLLGDLVFINLDRVHTGHL